MLHGVDRLSDPDFRAVDLYGTAKDLVSSENSSDALASAGTQKSREAVDFALIDIEIERLDAGVAYEALSFKNRHRGTVDCCNIALALDVGHVVQVLAEHLGNELYSGEILDDIFANECSVS